MKAGTLYCYDRTSLPIVRYKMAYIGYEPQRETIKYRCPARHEGWSCPHDAVQRGKSYGKTVRVDRGIDLRRFRQFRGPPRSSSGCTTAARQSRESTLD